MLEYPLGPNVSTLSGVEASVRAVTYDRYGSLDQLVVRDVEQPRIGPDEVLVRVRAAGVHVADCFAVRGRPWPVRLTTGLLRPSPGIPGFDLAGEVVAVGHRVTRFRSRHAVFGTGYGTCAEYAVAPEATLVHKPDTVTCEHAAAAPTSALAALHGLRDAGRLQGGQRVLINGASGGVGTFAVQIAKILGAEVTGVCSTANIDLVRSLGADHVIDYTREDFTRSARRYDLVFDNVENRTLAECRRVLTESGTLVLNSGTGASGLRFARRLVAPLVVSPFVRHTLRRYLSTPNVPDLTALQGWLQSGALKPVIDRVCALEETAPGLRYIETGHARGKVVVRV